MKSIGKIAPIVTLLLLFTMLLVLFVYTLESFIEKSQKDPVNFTNNYVKQLINNQKRLTATIATRIAIDKEFAKAIINKQNYKVESIIGKTIFLFTTKDNLWIRVYDKDMKHLYISWKSKPPLKEDRNLKRVFKNKNLISNIEITPYNIAFKSIAPIFDKNNHLYGAVEVMLHFESISKTLKETQGINSAIIIDKRYTKELIKPLSHNFIDGYNIANRDIDKDVNSLLKEYGVDYFIQNTPKYIGGFFKSGYYISVVHIKNFYGNTLGYVLAFIEDRSLLKKTETILYTIFSIATMLFITLVYLLYKSYKNNLKLILTLDKKVKKKKKKNIQLLYKDQLTNTYNKEIFDIDRKKSSDKYIVLLNIKGFSNINGIYGFEVGDLVLKQMAILFMKLLDKRIYRLNADEFLFLSNDYQKDIEFLSNYFYNNTLNIKDKGIKLRLSFRFGVCENSLNGKIYKKLTIALQEAKKITYANYIFYDENKQRGKNRENYIKFNNILYDALFTQNEAKIVPYFQPIIDNKSGKVVKYESLARLQYENEIYPPYYFINIAKNGGFSYEMTKIMLERSIKEISKYNDLIISINITEDDLLTNRLLDNLLNLTSKYGVKPKRVMLEILEGITNEETKSNIEQIKELKRAGFSLAIDDFGVDYSNFERIAELDIDVIKIDGKYIKTILDSEKSYLIVQTITNFAHKLGVKVTAEFVENKEIYDKIRNLNIEYSQGYYFGKPMPYIKDH